MLLFTVTLAVGALTFWHSRNDDDAVERFRSFFSYGTIYDLKRSLPPVTDQASLVYGGISLFSIFIILLMILLILKAARRNDPRRK